MIAKVLGFIFLFITRTRFLKSKSIVDITGSRYGEAFVRNIRKFERNYCKLWKDHMDLRF